MPPIPKTFEKAALAVALVAIIVLALITVAVMVPFVGILKGLEYVGDQIVDRIESDAWPKA